jgi:hypothetical protein
VTGLQGIFPPSRLQRTFTGLRKATKGYSAAGGATIALGRYKAILIGLFNEETPAITGTTC